MNPLNVLIVDDTKFMAEMLGALLTASDCRVVAVATNGEEAIEAYRQHRPDLVTMDITMPGMDGMAATRAIVREFPDAVIVMVTGMGEDKYVLNSLKAGAKGYILKPFEASNVREVIQKATKRKG
jgi:two-component system chemotaxis response regulator CheY